MPQFHGFCSIFQTKLANEGLYKASIGSMRLRLQELQKANSEAQKLRQQKSHSFKEIDEIFYYQYLPFIPKAISTNLISRHYNNPLAGHLGIEKTCELMAQKYYWPTLRYNVKAYVKSCDACLTSNTVRYKPYSNFQLLPILMH